MKPQSTQTHWQTLERNAHQPEIQELIRREIRRGTIRVVPGLNGGIRIIPIVCSMRSARSNRRSDRDSPGAGYTVG
jgi:hypothetical protein